MCVHRHIHRNTHICPQFNFEHLLKKKKQPSLYREIHKASFILGCDTVRDLIRLRMGSVIILEEKSSIYSQNRHCRGENRSRCSRGLWVTHLTPKTFYYQVLEDSLLCVFIPIDRGHSYCKSMNPFLILTGSVVIQQWNISIE